ncbi:uncharacterized protein LOC126979479 [Leptidea sinapis]|uniref:Pre-rRNA-processing protein TSR2 homolog n=1 Tax=Leptidea sinapis TaxID=189913 RepID=A0A5E4QVN9_9NEOP|nr:uncharacterized protein LOC126979479 [Leptidea sinapis]VVD02431.1 unnamed protein product [Leptidea sinapis]
MLYDNFKPIVDTIFNNWTALQLAVEQGMGAPGGEKTAQLMSVYVARYCVENVVDVDELAEVLEDLMDEEFDTACHDNSPKEIAIVLLNFLELLKAGHYDEVRNRMEALPPCQKWLSTPIQTEVPPQSHGNPDDDTTSSSSDEEQNDVNGAVGAPTNGAVPMEEDEVGPGWTLVRTRRKK